MEVVVHPGKSVISLRPGENLLQGLRANGLPISYSCEDGRCGLCRCRLLRGKVVESARPPRQLFGSRARYILACQSSPADDIAIDVPDTGEVVLHPSRRLRTRVLGIEPMSHSVRLLRLDNEENMAFSPGQFAELDLGRSLLRVYSMAGLPGDAELQFHVRLHPHGRASDLIGSDLLTPGTPLRLRGPYGASWLRQRHDAPILCIAAGTGLAPMLSVLRGIAASGLTNPVHVYAAFISREEVYGVDMLNTSLRAIPNLRAAHTVVAGGRLERGQRRGLLTEVIEQDLGDLSHWHAQVYGSPFAIDATLHLLRRLGIAEDRLHADPFHPSGH